MPSKPAPRPIRASGVARTAILFTVFSAITGMEMGSREKIMPAAMPRIMGFVRMPFSDFFRAAGDKPPFPSAVRERMITAATL